MPSPFTFKQSHLLYLFSASELSSKLSRLQLLPPALLEEFQYTGTLYHSIEVPSIIMNGREIKTLIELMSEAVTVSELLDLLTSCYVTDSSTISFYFDCNIATTFTGLY
jgi:hypothetical protein